LADPHPVDFIHLTGETVVGFIGERCGDDPLHPRTAGSISKKSRINSVAGDDAKGVWNFHRARLLM
jgi:hypothetical protein